MIAQFYSPPRFKVLNPPEKKTRRKWRKKKTFLRNNPELNEKTNCFGVRGIILDRFVTKEVSILFKKDTKVVMNIYYALVT